jgi:hypothetical protein
MTFREAYKKENDAVVPDSAFVESMLADLLIEDEERRVTAKIRRFRRLSAVFASAAAVCLVVFGAVMFFGDGDSYSPLSIELNWLSRSEPDAVNPTVDNAEQESQDESAFKRNWASVNNSESDVLTDGTDVLTDGIFANSHNKRSIREPSEEFEPMEEAPAALAPDADKRATLYRRFDLFRALEINALQTKQNTKSNGSQPNFSFTGEPLPEAVGIIIGIILETMKNGINHD